MPKKHRNIAFSLSFLDIMACGFGAVTLLFLILRHNAVEIQTPDVRQAAEVNMLLTDIRQADAEKTRILNSLEQINSELVNAQGLSDRVATDLQEAEKSIQSDPNEMDKWRREIAMLKDKIAKMEDDEYGNSTNYLEGDGIGQTLSGCTFGGQRILILVDGSASMLSEEPGNVELWLTYDEEMQKQSPKWQWTLRTVEYLISELPASSRFQIYIFNTSVEPALANSEGEWQDAADPLAMEQAIAGLKQYTPSSGTSLINGFGAIADFADRPDNVFLLTDGLPTQGKNLPKSSVVSGRQRRSHFLAAMKEFPQGVPLNTLLFPLDGDYEAAALFWKTAVDTSGCFIAPAKEWI